MLDKHLAKGAGLSQESRDSFGRADEYLHAAWVSNDLLLASAYCLGGATVWLKGQAVLRHSYLLEVCDVAWLFQPHWERTTK